MSIPKRGQLTPESLRSYYESTGLECQPLDQWGLVEAVDRDVAAAKRRDKPNKGSDAAKAKMARVRAAKETKDDDDDDHDEAE